MSYSLYLWKWKGERHMAAGSCFLLMAEGFECDDAAILASESLRRRLLEELNGVSGSVDCEAVPRGLFIETHGADPTRLRDVVLSFAHRERLVVFDPQVDTVSEDEKRESETWMRRLKSEDDQSRLRAEMPELVAKADRGDADSLFDLGNRYFFGEGAATDIARAFEYYRRAAEAGSDAGMVNLASCYRNGEGVKADPVRAAEWYAKAMTTDKTFAPYELAQMYETGEGVKRDRERALELFAVALDGGHPDALKALRRLGQLSPGAQAFVRR